MASGGDQVLELAGSGAQDTQRDEQDPRRQPHQPTAGREEGPRGAEVRGEREEALTGVERIQYIAFQERYLGLLEIAWTQYKSGSLAFIDWRDWDKYLSDFVTDGLPKEWWIECRSRYKPEFAEHVDSKYDAS